MCYRWYKTKMLDSGDTAWILASTALVVLMTPGVGLFYAGMVRGKNVVSMIALAFVALVLVSVQWVLVGYSLAFRSNIAGFVGPTSALVIGAVAGVICYKAMLFRINRSDNSSRNARSG